MRKLFFVLVSFMLSQVAFTQTKVFNQIAGSIRSDLSEITQNRKVVGYVRLVQLEKTDKQTYNYELNIMDENLNDISTARFSDSYLSMNDVAFEQDMLCIPFVKGTSETALYFINLEGKVIKIQNIESKKTTYGVTKNIPGVGFVFHKRAKDFSLIAFDPKGKQLWEKSLEREAFYLAATPKMVSYYDYTKDRSLNFINAVDGKGFYSHELEIKKFYSHQFTGTQVYGDTVYYSGFITPYNVYGLGMKYKHLKKGYQKGVVVVKAWGPGKKTVKVTETKWAESDLSDITRVAGNPENKKENYLFENSVTANDGTTYFFAENIQRKFRATQIPILILTTPFVLPVPFVVASGFNKYHVRDATIFKLTPNNRFSKVSTIEQAKSRGSFAKMRVEQRFTRNIIDEEGSQAYFVGGDGTNLHVTNLSSKKTKYIPRWSNGIGASIYPAKEGHYMLVETNGLAKTIKLSIVPLQ